MPEGRLREYASVDFGWVSILPLPPHYPQHRDHLLTRHKHRKNSCHLVKIVLATPKGLPKDARTEIHVSRECNKIKRRKDQLFEHGTTNRVHFRFVH